MTTVEELYKCYDVLSNAEDILTHEFEYKTILSAANEDASLKKLACQFIPRFFKDFPELMNSALDAYIDLLEDTDSVIRRLAIKELPQFCKGLPGVVARISAILVQMFVFDEPVEIKLVESSLSFVFDESPQNCVEGILAQISIADIKSDVCVKGLRFLLDNIKLKQIKFSESFLKLIRDNLLPIITSPNTDISQLNLSLKLLQVSQNNQSEKEIVISAIERTIISFLKIIDNDRTKHIETLFDFVFLLSPLSDFFQNILDVLFKNLNTIMKSKEYNGLLKRTIQACRRLSNDDGNLIEIVYNEINNIIPIPPKDLDPEKIASFIQSVNINYDTFEPVFIDFAILYSKNLSFKDFNDKNSPHLKEFRERLQFLIRVIQSNTSSQTSKNERPRIKAPGQLPNETNIASISGPKSVIVSIAKGFLQNPLNVNPKISPSFPLTTSLPVNNSTTPLETIQSSKHKRILPPSDINRKKIRISSEIYIPPHARNSENTLSHKNEASRS